MTFKSAVDSWYYLMIVVIAVAVVAPAIPLFREGQPMGLIVPGSAALFAIGLPVWLLIATDYTLTAEQLLVRSGPFKWRIPRAEIRSVAPSRSVLSGPALSLDRLEIRYGRMGAVLVSPADRAGFIAALGLSEPAQRAAE